MPYPNKSKTKVKFPWIGQVRVHGIKRRKQFANKKHAIKWEAEEKQRMEQELSRLPTEPIAATSLLQWATAYLEFAEKKFVKKTFEEKRLAFRLLFNNPEVDPDSDVDSLKPITVLKHLQVQEGEKTGNVANKQRKNLRAAWQWGVRFMEMPASNPFSAVFKFAEVRKERYVPPLEDFWLVYDLASEGQDKLMLLMYLHTGARRDELFRLRWADVDFFGRRIRLFWRKNKAGQWKSAWLPATDETMDMLRVHQKVTGLKPFVFMNMQGSNDPKNWLPYVCRQKFLSELCMKAGVKEFGFHGIRHLFASILAAEKRALVEIQMMLRHDHLTTTQRYIHSLNKEGRDVLVALPGPVSRSKSPLKAPRPLAAF